ESRASHQGPGPPDRPDQDARPQRRRPRRGRRAGGRHCPLHGHRGRRLARPIIGPRRRTSPPNQPHSPRESEEDDMTKHGKAYADATQRYDRDRPVSARDALELVRSLAPAKFDETVEAAFRLGVDPRKADQMIRGTVSLPNGTGKTVRVAVFAVGDKAEEAAAAGADVVGSDDLIEKIQGGWLEFDAAIATPDQMAKVGRVARILGPRGLMPNPKTGTVTPDVAKAVNDIKGGKINFRVDKQ